MIGKLVEEFPHYNRKSRSIVTIAPKANLESTNLMCNTVNTLNKLKLKLLL